MKSEPLFILEGSTYVPVNCKKTSVNTEKYTEEEKSKSGVVRHHPKQKTVTTTECDLTTTQNEEQSDKEYLEKQRDRDKVKRKEKEINPLIDVNDDFKSISRGIVEEDDISDKKKKYIVRIVKRDKVPRKASDELSDTNKDDIEEYNKCGQIYHSKSGKWVNPDKEDGSLTYTTKKGCGGSQHKRVGKQTAGNSEPCGRRNPDKTCKD